MSLVEGSILKLSDAALVAGIVATVSGSLGLLTSVFLANASAGASPLAASVNAGDRWPPAGTMVAGGGHDALGDQAVVTILARMAYRGEAAKVPD